MGTTTSSAHYIETQCSPYIHPSVGLANFTMDGDFLGNGPCPIDNPFFYVLCTQTTPELVWTVIKTILIVILIIFTVFGNSLVIVAVVTSRNLRSSTHYLIVNLAVADLLLGICVLPFSAMVEITGVWYLGQTMCTVWTCLDVLCCTSSILSLMIISIDRYVGVTHPLDYSRLMEGNKIAYSICVCWLLSAGISILPIFGWKEDPSPDPYVCHVNKKIEYVIFSSLCSFYIPMIIILFVYWRIYLAAIRQMRFLECGHKTTKQDVTLRVHLGGNANMNMRMNSNPDLISKMQKNRDTVHVTIINDCRDCQECQNCPECLELARDCRECLQLAPIAHAERSTSSLNKEDYPSGASGGEGEGKNGDSGVVLRVHRGGSAGSRGELTWTPAGSRLRPNSGNNNKLGNRSTSPRRINTNGFHQNTNGGGGTSGNGGNNGHQSNINHIHHHYHHHHHHIQKNGGGGNNGHSLTPSPPSSSPERKLNLHSSFGKGMAKFLKQKKAAKTLALVVGAFLFCWFPFFFILTLGALCKKCDIPNWIFNLFFWLGYANSGFNPVIYGCTSNDFRRAFRKVLCRRIWKEGERTVGTRAIFRANTINNRDRNLNGGNNVHNMIQMHQWA